MIPIANPHPISTLPSSLGPPPASLLREGFGPLLRQERRAEHVGALREIAVRHAKEPGEGGGAGGVGLRRRRGETRGVRGVQNKRTSPV